MKDDKERKKPKGQVHKLALPSKGAGITLRELQELVKKDPNQLTALQKRQIEEAHKMAADFAQRLKDTYDFSGVIKAVQTTPALKIAETLQQSSKIVVNFQRNLIIPTQSLLTLQKFALSYGNLGKEIASIANAALPTRSMFADFQSFHTRLVKSLSIDISTLNSIARITATEAIKFSFERVIEQDGHIAAISDASQSKRIDDYQLVHNADIKFLFTELNATKKELAEIKHLIQTGVESGKSKIEYANVTFKRGASKLVIKGHEIFVQGSARQAIFCDMFFSSPSNFVKKWDIVELLSQAFSLHPGTDGNEDRFVSIVKGYVKALNTKIEAGTKGIFPNFFVLLDLEVYVNRDYISNL